jgi:transcriptional regulator GlxA family with amidase domain
MDKNKPNDLIFTHHISLLISPRTTDEQHALPPFDLRVMLVMRLIQEQYQQPGLSLSNLAKQSNVSICHLARSFKKQIGLTVMQYLRRVRMNKAEDLLANSMLSIKEVSAAVGYNYVSDFDHHFKTNYKMNPGQYRQLKVRLVLREAEQKLSTNSNHT